MKFSSKVEKCGQSPMRKFHPYAVAAKARKVFYHDRIDLVLFHCFTYFFDPVPVKVHAADIVVKGFAGDGESVFLSISGNDAELIGQGIEFFVLVP